MKILKKIKIKWILLAALIILIAFPLTANAQQGSVTGQTSDVLGEVLQSFASFLAVTLQLLQRILWPIFLAIGGLLNNDILFGYGMEQRLLEVWVQIRNFVNIIFVVALLGVALFNVLALKPDSEFALKSFLPKFAIALIAVNFSYIGMKVILDVSNVMTYAVFALPTSISSEVATPDFMNCTGEGTARTCNVKEGDESKKIVQKICKAYYGEKLEWDKLQKEIDNLPGDQKGKVANSLLCTLSGNTYTFSDEGKKFFGKYNSRNAGLVMAIQFMNVTKVDDVGTSIVRGSDAKTSDGKIDIAGLSFQLLFAVVLYIVYGAAYVALFVVLLVRLIVLWLFIALSPVVVLKFILPQGVMPDSGGDIGQKFLKNAFAPVLMGVPLTIGYIILEAFKGAGISGATDLRAVSIDTVAISDLQSMIIAFAAVAVVWVGVFAAAEGTFARFATDFIKQKVGGLGTKAMQGLQMLPIIPAGKGGKGVSLYQAQDIGKGPWEEMMRKYGPASLGQGKASVQEIQDIGKSKTAKPEEMRQIIQNANLSDASAQKALAASLEQWKGRSGEQGNFAKEAIRKIGDKDYKALTAGTAGTAAIAAIKNIPSLRPTPQPNTPQRPNTPAGGSGGAGTGAAAGGAPESVTNVNAAEDLGIVSPDLIQKREEWRTASRLQDENQRKEATKKVETELSGNDEVKNLKKALEAKADIQPVTTRVNTKITKDTTGQEVQDLEKDLKKASDALKSKRVPEADSKKLLGNILKGKLGDDAKEFVNKNTGIGKYVTVD